MSSKGTKKKKSNLQKLTNNAVKAVERKDPKYLSKFAKAAKPYASFGLDAVSTVFPFLKAPREMLRAVAGFDERRLGGTSGGMDGGAVVRTMDAPVAFARNQVQTGWRVLGPTADGGELWSFCDMPSMYVTGTANVVRTAATANTFFLTLQILTPVNIFVFPNFYQTAAIWERWRPLKSICHYCHFAPTSVQSAVAIAISEDSTVNSGASEPTTMSNFMALEHSIQGSCYEDFSLSVTPASWKAGTWLYTDPVGAAADADQRMETAGTLYLATDANSSTNTPLGYIYFELLFEVCGKRAPLPGISVVSEFDMCVSRIPPENRKEFFEHFVKKLWGSVSNYVEKKSYSPGNPDSRFVPAMVRDFLLEMSPPSKQNAQATGSLSCGRLANRTGTN